MVDRKAQMLVSGEKGTQFLKAAQSWAEAHLGHWGQGMRAAPPSGARCSAEDLPLEVHGLFLGPACCPGCCTSCFWRKTEEHEADSPATLSLSSPLATTTRAQAVSYAQAWPDQSVRRQAPWMMHPIEPLLIPLTPLLSIISLLFTFHNVAYKQYKLDSLAPIPQLEYKHWR